ncbi:glycosyltransferase [[Clostridium] leptum]|nr:glycosyltransferase [[Clostridium] leptum]
MRIALFVETYLPYINGVVTHIKVLKDGLTALGHEVLIVTADPHAKHHYIEDGVLHCPAHPLKQLYGYGLAKPISRVRMRYLKQFNPDVLHMHQEFSVGFFSTMAAKKLNKPLVYTLHTMYDEYLFYVAPKPFVPAARKISHQYTRHLAKRASAVTSPSHKADEYFKECRVKKKVEVIPNSIDYEAFDPANTSPEKRQALREKMGIREGDTALIFLGRLGKEKSVDLLLDYLAEQFPDEDRLRLVVVGDGPETDALKQQAKRLGLDHRVTFTGSVDHSEVPAYFSACDIYVSASLTEMMSISMLEGMASGLPVVLRYDPLNASQIEEGVNGYNYKTPEEMASIIRNLMNLSQEEKDAMRVRVRESVRNAGAINLAKYMLKIYSRVTGIPVEEEKE